MLIMLRIIDIPSGEGAVGDFRSLSDENGNQPLKVIFIYF